MQGFFIFLGVLFLIEFIGLAWFGAWTLYQTVFMEETPQDKVKRILHERHLHRHFKNTLKDL
jgi:hypothetical protein